MTQRVYLGGVCGSDGRYGIVFPDFPGCVSAGETLVDVVAMGREALQFHVEGMVEDGEILPEPSAVDFERLEAEFGDDEEAIEDEPWVAIVAIEVVVPTFRGTVPIPSDTALVQEVDSVVANRRQFIMDATRRELDRLRKPA
ncbi:MAG: type II toxin-antitoxin system HicB family antitoxin [Sphingomonadaceae bacterium]